MPRDLKQDANAHTERLQSYTHPAQTGHGARKGLFHPGSASVYTSGLPVVCHPHEVRKSSLSLFQHRADLIVGVQKRWVY